MNRIIPPKTWNNDMYYLDVLSSEWYKTIAILDNELHFATAMFYRDRGIDTMFLPVTTGSISSPMGLGSDSVPVSVTICDVKTYLADSMQFMLEFGCASVQMGAITLCRHLGAKRRMKDICLSFTIAKLRFQEG